MFPYERAHGSTCGHIIVTNRRDITDEEKETSTQAPRAMRPRSRSSIPAWWPPAGMPFFIVLDANPLDHISNTRRIDKVYLRGPASGTVASTVATN